MAVTITYSGSTIHTSEKTETFTLLTNNLIMKSDIVVYTDSESKVDIMYNGEALNLDTSAGEHTYNLLCAGKLMLSNLTVSVLIEGSISYTNVMKCTTNETITLPDSQIMIVVIGGGTGGQGGYSGKSGNQPIASQGEAYEYYSLELVGQKTDYGEVVSTKYYSMVACAYYKSVSLDTYTGKLTFSDSLNPNSNYYVVDGATYKQLIAKYPYYRVNSSSYYRMEVRAVSNVDHRFGTKYEVGNPATAYRNGESKYTSYTSGGQGGKGGNGGSGGKVLRKELTVPSGSTATIKIGSGGAYGEPEGKYGKAGSASTITINDIVYSSDNGVIMPDGFKNTVGVEEPEIYAAQGITGIEGAAGGGYTLYYNSEVGGSVNDNVGGAVGNNQLSNSQYIGGGSGGGAAYGSNGNIKVINIMIGAFVDKIIKELTKEAADNDSE